MMEEQVIVAQQLVKHPKLFERFKNMLAIVDNDEEGIISADAAEQQIIDEIRELGKDMMQSWAEQQSEKVSKNYKNKTQNIKHNGKKNCIGTLPLE